MCLINCLKETLKRLISVLYGITLGQLYYYYFLKDIELPYEIGKILSVIISLLLGLGNAISVQVRCISLLTLPMFCGKAGRGVLKAIVLTYVIAGPITNMGYNAKEVVRVFACSTELSYNLSEARYKLLAKPIKNAIVESTSELNVLKYAFRVVVLPRASKAVKVQQKLCERCYALPPQYISIIYQIYTCYSNLAQDLLRDDFMMCYLNSLSSINNIVTPLKNEIEDTEELQQIVRRRSIVEERASWRKRSADLKIKHRSNDTGHKTQTATEIEGELYQSKYLTKLKYRCMDHVTRGIFNCMEMFARAYIECISASPHIAMNLCWPLKIEHACDIRQFVNETKMCDGRQQIDPGLGEGYLYLTRIRRKMTDNLNNVKLQYKVAREKELYNVQTAKETGEKVMHEFEQKCKGMQFAVKIVKICVALMALRLIVTAQGYHDKYLRNITYDNVYITSYFKRIDRKRKLKNKYTVLPLKKMERNKYVDVHSLEYKTSRRSKVVTPILKVMLEVVTATTFVMLDRLFYEALDVVRQHASLPVQQQGTKDLEIEVEGIGTVANMMRNVMNSLNASRPHHEVSNKMCLPRPRAMPAIYFVKIYCGYLWILLLLYLNPYTIRLRRLICSYFYPRREKNRILHLYNDILKKRMKMQKTLRRKALQAVRAHYLSGESLRSLRMRYPRLLGWLSILPAARMTCLICEETEPRFITPCSPWRRCMSPTCGLAWCEECWREAGERCLACDPALARLSDLESLSDDRPVDY